MIKLTLTGGSHFFINPAHIESFERPGALFFTRLYGMKATAGDESAFWEVEETPEEILALLRAEELREFAKAAMQGLAPIYSHEDLDLESAAKRVLRFAYKNPDRAGVGDFYGADYNEQEMGLIPTHTDADDILRAANSHAALVEALNWCLHIMAGVSKSGDYHPLPNESIDAQKAGRAALSAARGGEVSSDES